jgi:general secretion pathway protein N
MAEHEVTWKSLIPSLLLLFLTQGVAALPSSDALDADVVDDPPVNRSIQTPSDPQVRSPTNAGMPQAGLPAREQAPSANPLWAIPLSQLSETRDRPIFSVSRRAPAPPAAAKPVAAKAPPPKVPERPQLSLVGTIASGEEGFGIFLDQATKTALRLKVGEDHNGWRLQSIRAREVTLEKDKQTSVLSLPVPVGEEGIVHPVSLPVWFEGQRK